MKCIAVEWLDSAHLADWNAKEDVEALGSRPEFTCGILVRESEREVVVALSHAAETGQYGHVIAIPKACIKSMNVFNQKAQKRQHKVSAPHNDNLKGKPSDA